MALNLFVFLFFGLMAGLLVYFPLRRAATKTDFRPLVLFFVTIGVVFVGNALFAVWAAHGLWMAWTMSPVVSLGRFTDVADGAPAVVAGVVSIENPMVLGSYVAYTACDEASCNLRHVPSGLQIAVDDGSVILINDDFEAVDWPAANRPPEDLYAANFLASGEPVVIAGNKVVGTALRADIVYAGSHAAFAARAGRRLVMPGVMFALNMLGLAVVVVLPVRRYRAVVGGGDNNGG